MVTLSRICPALLFLHHFPRWNADASAAAAASPERYIAAHLVHAAAAWSSPPVGPGLDRPPAVPLLLPLLGDDGQCS